MKIARKIHRAFRGDVGPKALALELLRRSRVSLTRNRERARLQSSENEAAHLLPVFARMSSKELLAHFRNREQPYFFPGFSDGQSVANAQRSIFPSQTVDLVGAAERIIANHSWRLLGFDEKCFGAEINWHQDPVSGVIWPLEFHQDIELHRGDGSDARVLWELNRLGHLITLSRAFVVTKDEKFAVEVFTQLESWTSQNPFGRGVNWTCAMEVALRAMNLLGIFQLLRHSEQMSERSLSLMLSLLDGHGRFIQRNLEFSYIATSNHYLSDVVGLLWLGLLLPELENGKKWRSFGRREMLREMDKQVLPDGADFESSTGYHRLASELFLYSFILCRANGIRLDEKYWQKLHKILAYSRAYLRPDGMAPLIGDSDSGQVFPIRRRVGRDHAYVSAIGATLFKAGDLKPSIVEMPEELLWILGHDAVLEYQKLTPREEKSGAFPEAGTYIFRQDDLYLLFNASGAGIHGRGSHGHNDVLSIEVSACGRAFIVDPGTFVYTANLRERQLFRSTGYHSTVEVDDIEQNVTLEEAPFVIGDEAHPRCVLWETGVEVDRVIAEHDGYRRLPQPVTHRRSVTFHKPDRWWLVEDEFVGEGDHNFAIRFHFDAGLKVDSYAEGMVLAAGTTNGTKLLVCPLDSEQKPELESQFTSSDYGEKKPSVSACWSMSGRVPRTFRWAIIPVCEGDSVVDRLNSIRRTV
jgi:hypothetical protein